jgi:hypothetical protein
VRLDDLISAAAHLQTALTRFIDAGATSAQHAR